MEETWYTDRTRIFTGLGKCARARYLSNYAGPTGYGLTHRRDSLPLATGISAHQGLERFAQVLRDHDRLPTQAETRLIVKSVVADYVQRVDARGFRGVLGSADTELTIKEQAALIAGLLWALSLKVLPWLHEFFVVKVVEEERVHPLGAGKALMIRTDILAQRRGGSSLAYFEAKTTGWESSAWAEQWETSPQLALGTVDAERVYGGEVTELYILGLNKGRRAKDRYDPTTERKVQQSPLCYGYRRPGNPPLAPEDWLPSYEWTTDAGEVKRKTKAHVRTGVWELAESDWPAWLAYSHQDPALDPVEFWVHMLPKSVLDRICFVLGPMNRQDHQLAATLRAIDAEETRWQETLWRLYELQQTYPWASEVFQSELDRLVPCSWNCRPYGREHQCEYVNICHRHTGWDDPIGSGQFVPRLPHHEPELKQAIARGLIPDQAETPEEE